MPTATVTLTVATFDKAGIDQTVRCQILRGTAVFDSGNYVAGGIAVNWNQAGKTASGATVGARFYGKSGYVYVHDPVADKVLIFQVPSSTSLATDLPLDELGAVAIPAAVQSDVIHFEAYIAKA